MKKQKTGLIVSLSVLFVTMAAMGGLIGGVKGAVNDLEVALNENTANAILASAEVGNDTVVTVPILYYDQVMDDCVNLYDTGSTPAVRARQFEWESCDYRDSKIETGLVEAELNSQYLPVGLGGEGLSNSGLSGENFERWFNQVEGKSKNYAGMITLTYDDRIASFGYRNENFYPLDEVDLASDEAINSDGHNHLFTLNLGVPFRVLADGREEFSIEADDDTWVFVGDALVLDMGGIHDAVVGRFRINEAGEIYSAVGNIELAYSGVTLESGSGAILRIFHADRNSKSSLFGIRMTNMVPNVTNATLAQSDAEVEIAYDPANPSYIAPLGESLAVGPDNRQSLITMIVIQVVTLGALGALVVVSISVAYRYLRSDHSQEEQF